MTGNYDLTSLAAAIVDRIDPHCIGWAHAIASLWGMASQHELDEPVRLSDEVPVRVRIADGLQIVTDRTLSLKALRPATHVALRFYFKNRAFHEVDLLGVPHLSRGEIANIDPRGRR